MYAIRTVLTWTVFLMPTITFGGLWLAEWPAWGSTIFWQGYGFGVLTCIWTGMQTALLLFARQSKYI